MTEAGDRAPKFPFNRTDYVHVGEEIILREGSNLKGTRGLMPISAHLIQSYVNAIDESKRKYAAEQNIEIGTEEETEEKVEEKNEDISENKTEDEPEEKIADTNDTAETEIGPETEPIAPSGDEPSPEDRTTSGETEAETSRNLDENREDERDIPSIGSALVDVPILL